MSITSPIFYAALIVVASCFYIIPGRLRHIYLLVISYLFYAMHGIAYLAILFCISTFVYVVGVYISKSKNEATKARLMITGVIVVASSIVSFKVAGISSGILLPLGLS